MTPHETRADKASMLPSTDWFLSYSSVIGIEPSGQKLRIQEGCSRTVIEEPPGPIFPSILRVTFRKPRRTLKATAEKPPKAVPKGK